MFCLCTFEPFLISKFVTFPRILGVYCVVVTDRDGVPLIRVGNEKTPELALKPSFLCTFAMATDQSSKLGLGKNKSIVSMYSNYQVNIPNQKYSFNSRL